MCKYLSDFVYLCGRKECKTRFNYEIKVLGETFCQVWGSGVLQTHLGNQRGKGGVSLQHILHIRNKWCLQSEKHNYVCILFQHHNWWSCQSPESDLHFLVKLIEAKPLPRSMLQKWQCPDRICSLQLLTLGSLCLPQATSTGSEASLATPFQGHVEVYSIQLRYFQEAMAFCSLPVWIEDPHTARPWLECHWLR